MRTLLLAILLGLASCIPQPLPLPPAPPAPAPTPAPQPPPVPTPVPPPQPVPDPLAPFKAVKVGDPTTVLDALPAPTHTVTVGDFTIRSWETAVPRPSGGTVNYEIHSRAGVITALFAW